MWEELDGKERERHATSSLIEAEKIGGGGGVVPVGVELLIPAAPVALLSRCLPSTLIIQPSLDLMSCQNISRIVIVELG